MATMTSEQMGPPGSASPTDHHPLALAQDAPMITRIPFRAILHFLLEDRIWTPFPGRRHPSLVGDTLPSWALSRTATHKIHTLVALWPSSSTARSPMAKPFCSRFKSQSDFSASQLLLQFGFSNSLLTMTRK
uniref:Uncharacterized protein n=1 Tax=Triticum urartu TaxID=4572 RepID=A0A8R7PEN1_TRIUA